jgi:hypothetical protein
MVTLLFFSSTRLLRSGDGDQVPEDPELGYYMEIDDQE